MVCIHFISFLQLIFMLRKSTGVQLSCTGLTKWTVHCSAVKQELRFRRTNSELVTLFDPNLSNTEPTISSPSLAKLHIFPNSFPRMYLTHGASPEIILSINYFIKLSLLTCELCVSRHWCIKRIYILTFSMNRPLGRFSL